MPEFLVACRCNSRHGQRQWARDFLERGPPSSVRKALAQFETTTATTAEAAAALANELRFPLPAH